MDIKVSSNWDRWIRGFDQLAPEVVQAANTDLRAVWETFFYRSQDRVHILTGALLGSGRLDVRQSGTEVVFEVTYGNESVPYAEYEHRRGGSHAFLTLAWQETEGEFSQEFGKLFDNIVAKWS